LTPLVGRVLASQSCSPFEFSYFPGASPPEFDDLERHDDALTLAGARTSGRRGFFHVRHLIDNDLQRGRPR